ncbi:MAG: hypothetical protein ABL958_02310 [Bdellovibrionia bacterium]
MAVGVSQNILATISKILGQESKNKTSEIKVGQAVMTLRSTAKIVIGETVENAIEIGRLSVDHEVHLEKEIDEKILMGQESIWGNYFFNVSSISNLAETLELGFHEQNRRNHVTSERKKLNIDFDQNYQYEINLLTQDIQANFGFNP